MNIRFISEDELDSFEGWLRYQAVDAASLSAAELAGWRGMFDVKKTSGALLPKIGLMKFRPLRLAEYRYGVAVEEAGQLWLVLWIRRSPKGEFFVMVPRDARWDPHTSYHLDGTVHAKSYGQKFSSTHKRQPLTGAFRGHVSLGRYAGYGPKGVGAIADPSVFSGLIRVRPGLLGPRHGYIDVDLIEPSTAVAADLAAPMEAQEIFQDGIPWVVITVRR